MKKFDVVAVVLAACANIYALQFATLAIPALGKKVADYGGALPSLTELALKTWFSLGITVLPLLVLAGAFAARTPRTRRLLVATSVVMSAGAFVFLRFVVPWAPPPFVGPIK